MMLKLHDFSIIPSYGLLHGVRWFKTDVSEPPRGHIFKGQAVPLLGQLDRCPETSVFRPSYAA